MEYGLLALWIVGGVAALAAAWATNSQTVAWRSVGALTAVSCVVFVPSWPIWRRNMPEWTGKEAPKEDKKDAPRTSSPATTTASADATASKKSKNKKSSKKRS